MDKIWVRNITTDDINKVGSLNFGGDEWQNAYSEMIKRGYKFQIGRAKENPDYFWGLYLINPLDIQISPSKYRVVNDLNDSIKELQGFVNSTPVAEKYRHNNKSLIDLFHELEGAYKRAELNSGAAIVCAPPEASDSVINSQKEAYKQLIEAIKASSQEDRTELLKMVIGSSYLTDSAILAIIIEALGLQEEYTTEDGKDIPRCFH